MLLYLSYLLCVLTALLFISVFTRIFICLAKDKDIITKSNIREFIQFSLIFCICIIVMFLCVLFD
nr:MAG TPA: hypothetical protein [Caudoviricetes sp.]